MKSNILMDEKEIESSIKTISKNIIKQITNLDDLVLIGIPTRGVYLAERIIKEIAKDKKIDIPLGQLDITFYRDDIDSIENQPIPKETKILFDLTDKEVIIVDDVLFTGRSIRAGLDEIMDFGRPKKIKLAVLIDRGHREIPIHPDFVGKVVETDYTDKIKVSLEEIDKLDQVVLLK